MLDIWSVGVILYILLIGVGPFASKELATTYAKIKKVEYSFPPNSNLSEEAKDLITRIFVLRPSDRITLDEIITHPFFHNRFIPYTLPEKARSQRPDAITHIEYVAPSRQPAANTGLKRKREDDNYTNEQPIKRRKLSAKAELPIRQRKQSGNNSSKLTEMHTMISKFILKLNSMLVL